MYFDQYNYEVTMSEIESLVFAYKAKKWAEAPTGVGLKTDIILFRKDGTKVEIRNEDVLMDEINKMYEKEKEENYRIKDGLLKELIKNSSGELR